MTCTELTHTCPASSAPTPRLAHLRSALILRRGRSKEPLIQTFRELLKTQLNQG